MFKLICYFIGHKVRFSNSTETYVGYCTRCDQSIFEKRSQQRGEAILGILAVLFILSAAVADGIKNAENKESEQTEEVDQ